MYGKKQWRGRECEGRYSDLMTLFIRDLHINSGILGISVNNINEYPHYYFTIEYMKNIQTSSYINAIRYILDNSNMAVTIEANNSIIEQLPPDLINRCHIIYRIQDQFVQVLKPTDTVSIDAAWYRCHMIAKMHMQETTPSNYMYDEELKNNDSILDKIINDN